jgi:hypothetical protein
MPEGSGRWFSFNSTTRTWEEVPPPPGLEQPTVSVQQQGEIPLDSWDPRSRLPAGSVQGSLGSFDAPLTSPDARNAALSGGLGFLDSWQVLAEAGLPDSLIRDMLIGQEPSGGGGGSPYAGMYADLALRQQQHAEEQDYLANIADLAGMAGSRQANNITAQQNQAQLLGELAPIMSGGRQFMGGFEPYGAASAVGNYAGVPVQPRPIVTQNVPTGYMPQQESEYEMLLRQLLGV